MNASLSKIATQYISEFEAAAATPAAREKVHKEFQEFLGTCERLKALGVTFEAAAQSLVGKVEGELKSFGNTVVDHAEGLLA